jgi:hypothetical protein
MSNAIRFLGVCLVIAALTSSPSSFAAGQSAAKASAQVGNINILTSENLEWSQILTAPIKTPNGKALFVDVSLECGLYTRTKTVSQEGILDTSSADSGVRVQVVLDAGTSKERVAKPGEITFCRRTQTLSSRYAGIEECEDANGDGETTEDECETTPEETQLILDTMNANSFNFILDGVGAGVHSVSVFARIDLSSEAEAGEAEARAAIGHGTVTIETVRLAKNTPIDLS